MSDPSLHEGRSLDGAHSRLALTRQVVPGQREAPPGAHSIMQRSMQPHGQFDVKAARDNLRRIGIDNVRRAKRVLDGDFEGPEIEAGCLAECATAGTVLPSAGHIPGLGGGP